MGPFIDEVAIATTCRYLARMLQRTLPAGFVAPPLRAGLSLWFGRHRRASMRRNCWSTCRMHHLA